MTQMLLPVRGPSWLFLIISCKTREISELVCVRPWLAIWAVTEDARGHLPFPSPCLLHMDYSDPSEEPVSLQLCVSTNGIVRMEKGVPFHMVSVPVTARIDVLDPKRSDDVPGKTLGQLPIQRVCGYVWVIGWKSPQSPQLRELTLSSSWSLLGQDLSLLPRPSCTPPFPLVPYPLFGGRETQTQAGLEPQHAPMAIQCRQLGCGMYISRWTWMQSVCIGALT